MKSYLNTEELVALRGLPHAARTLYREGLRPYMDYATGIVGLKRPGRLSYQKFYELLEVRRERGSTETEFFASMEQVRAMLVTLGRAGLIAKVKGGNGKALPLVFKLIFADSDSLRLREEPQRNHSEEPQRNHSEEPQGKNVSLYNKNQQDSLCITTDEPQQIRPLSGDEQHQILQKTVEEPQTSDIPLVVINTKQKKAVDNCGNGFLISPDWLPNDSAVFDCINLGFDADFVLARALEFRLYWTERGETRNSWDELYLWWFKKNIRERNGEYVSNRKD